MNKADKREHIAKLEMELDRIWPESIPMEKWNVYLFDYIFNTIREICILKGEIQPKGIYV